MSDIELVIKVPEDTYKDIIKNGFIYDEDNEVVTHAIKNGTPLPKGHGALKDADKVENITWQEPYYHDALNVLSEVRDKVRELPTIIEADKAERSE